MNAYCEFCGWEGSDEVYLCPKCHEYKGIIRARDRYDDPSLDAKIREAEADPEWQGREP